MARIAMKNAAGMAATLLVCSSGALAREAPMEPDDPAGRREAMEAVGGARTPGSAIEILRIAHQEAVRWSVTNPAAPRVASTVQSNAWINVGPSSADFARVDTFHKVDSGRPRSILVDPRDENVVYVAMAGGGVWKTFNALAPISATSGPRWWPITESIGSLSTGALAMSPANPDSLLLGLGDPFAVHVPGLLHSDDGGITWAGDASGAPVVLTASYPGSAAPMIATSVHDIQYAPAGDVVLAATDVGLFRSTEGGIGTGWNLIDLDAAHRPQNCWSLAFLGEHTWLLTSVDLTVQQAGPLGRLWRSIDDGLSWSNVTSGLGVNAAADVARMTLAASAVDRATPDAARVYLLAQNGDQSDQKDVFRSNDGGRAWTSLGMFQGSGKSPTNPNGHQPDLDLMHQQAFYNHMIAADPRNHDVVFVGGNLAMVRSRDGGTTWDVMADWLPIDTGRLGSQGLPLSMYVHADWHAAAIVHTDTSFAFYAGTDGGIFRSTDLLTAAAGQATWEDRLNRGIVSHLLYSVRTGTERVGNASCTVPAGNADIIIGGLQDDGTRLRSPSSTPNWDPTVFNEVAGGDGFDAGIGCAPPTPPNSSAVGSLLLSTYVATVNRSVNGGDFEPATIGFPDPTTLDPQFNFVMKMATDLNDPLGQTFVVPLTVISNSGCPSAPPCRLAYAYRTTNGALSWTSMNAAGKVHRIDNTTRDNFIVPHTNIGSDPTHANRYAVTTLFFTYLTTNGGDAQPDWIESNALILDSSDPQNLVFISPHAVAIDHSDPNGTTVWVGSKDQVASNGSAIPANLGHLFKCNDFDLTNHCKWVSMVGTGAAALPNVPVNVIKLDPGDPTGQTVYVGTEIGLYRSTNGGASWGRFGTGLPLVSVTDLAISADGSSIRAATYGRGFWEIYPKAGGSPSGAHGNGDFDHDQVIDAFDLVDEAAELFLTNADATYDAAGNLIGSANAIDEQDLAALAAKLGGRP